MRKFLDDIENAAAKLKDIGEKAVQSASERLEELMPAIQDGADKALDAAKGVCDKARPFIEDGIEKTVQSAKDLRANADSMLEKAEDSVRGMFDDAKSAFERAADSLMGGPDGSVQQEVPSAPEKPLTLEEEIEADVAQQVGKIRAAEFTPGAFSDYIAKKFGKDQ